jgi:pimeloyl-ACP methyl ester carboxylesterase
MKVIPSLLFAATLITVVNDMPLQAFSFTNTITHVRPLLERVALGIKNHKKCLLGLVLLVGVTSYAAPAICKSYSFKYLSIDEVSEGYFKAEDGVNLHYRLIKRPNATSTVIVNGGFYPGNKDEALPLLKALPISCNVLFFDGRGRGKSDQSFLGLLRTASGTYGLNERKDVVAAIQFNQKQTHKPCILLGLCAGAYNNMHAVLQLESEQHIKMLNVIGLINDSAWGSFNDALNSTAKSFFHTPFMTCLSYLCDKQTVKSSTLWRLLTAGIDKSYDGLHRVVFDRLIDKTATNIADKINLINVPMLFIHSHDDEDVPIGMVQELANNAKKECTHCWWIDEPSKHAEHHIKHQLPYGQKVSAFVEYVLQQAKT